MAEDSLIPRLKQLAEEIRLRGVQRLTLFGPEARGEGKSGSEVHLLLELEPPVTFEHYLQVRDFLVQALGRPVELVLEKVEHPLIWEFVEDDAVEILR